MGKTASPEKGNMRHKIEKGSKNSGSNMGLNSLEYQSYSSDLLDGLTENTNERQLTQPRSIDKLDLCRMAFERHDYEEKYNQIFKYQAKLKTNPQKNSMQSRSRRNNAQKRKY